MVARDRVLRARRRARSRSCIAPTRSRAPFEEELRAAAHSLRRGRRHEVLRARRGQGRPRVPAAGRAPGRRPRLPPRRQRAGARASAPPRSIGSAQAARETGQSWWEVSGGSAAGPLRARAHLALARFRAVVEDLRGEGGDLDALGAARAPPGGRPAMPRCTRSPRTARTSRAARTSRSCSPRRASSSGATPRARPSAEYLDTVALATDADAAPAGGAVTLSTLHAAKGLEFAQVFAGGARGGLPAARPVRRGRGRARGGAAAALRGHDPRQGRARR